MSVALHRGEVVLFADRVGGTVVDRAADLAAIGSSGTVVVSESAVEHLAGRMPAELVIVERGAHRLFDLGRPERVWQLMELDAPAESAPLKSLSSFPNNLPTQLTPFIGRHREIDAVVELVAAERLVTVTGVGGVGRTPLRAVRRGSCLAVIPGRRMGCGAGFGGGGRRFGQSSVPGALRVGERPGVPIEVQVAVAFSDKPSLLVLDNCEHLSARSAPGWSGGFLWPTSR